LSQLGNFPIDPQSQTARELLDPHFWNTVDAAWSGDMVRFLPETVVGFLNSSENWRNCALANISNPPSWVANGPMQALDSQLSCLQTLALVASSGSVGAAAIKQFAASIAGVDLAEVDLVSLNGATSFLTYVTTGNAIEASIALPMLLV
jgi:hypothetical protein